MHGKFTTWETNIIYTCRLFHCVFFFKGCGQNGIQPLNSQYLENPKTWHRKYPREIQGKLGTMGVQPVQPLGWPLQSLGVDPGSGAWHGLPLVDVEGPWWDELVPLMCHSCVQFCFRKQTVWRMPSFRNHNDCWNQLDHPHHDKTMLAPAPQCQKNRPKKWGPGRHITVKWGDESNLYQL